MATSPTTPASLTASRPAGPSAQAGPPQGLQEAAARAGGPCPWSVSRAPPLVAAQPASASTPTPTPRPRGVHGSRGQAGPGRLPCRGREPHCMRTRRPEPSRVSRSRLSDPPSSPRAPDGGRLLGFCRLCVGGACFLLGAVSLLPFLGRAERSEPGCRRPRSLGSEWGAQAEGLWAVLASLSSSPSWSALPPPLPHCWRGDAGVAGGMSCAGRE